MYAIDGLTQSYVRYRVAKMSDKELVPFRMRLTLVSVGADQYYSGPSVPIMVRHFFPAKLE